MSPISFTPSSLKEGRLNEYLIRFALGGTATVFTGLVSSRCGASIGSAAEAAVASQAQTIRRIGTMRDMQGLS